MPVVRLTLAYDGTAFRGWARQRGQRTVEGVLSDALARVLGWEPRLSVAGRTDAGVHARGQAASFASAEPPDLERLRRSLNGMLSPEVAVRHARRAPEGFDARFSASAREYRYRIDTGEVADPFTARFVWHRPGRLRVAQMRGAAAVLVGEHDFASFCRHPGPGRATVRDLERLTVTSAGDRVELGFRANAFLHQMVRAITGTLVLVGDRKLDPDDVARLLAKRDRTGTGNLAPAHGLTLERVIYGRRGR